MELLALKNEREATTATKNILKQHKYSKSADYVRIEHILVEFIASIADCSHKQTNTKCWIKLNKQTKKKMIHFDDYNHILNLLVSITRSQLHCSIAYLSI